MTEVIDALSGTDEPYVLDQSRPYKAKDDALEYLAMFEARQRTLHGDLKLMRRVADQRLQSELQNLASQYEAEISRIGAENAGIETKVGEDLDRRLKAAQQAHDDAVVTLHKAHKAEIQRYRQQSEVALEQLKARQSDLVENLERAITVSVKEQEGLVAATDDQIKRWRDVLDWAERSIAAIESSPEPNSGSETDTTEQSSSAVRNVHFKGMPAGVPGAPNEDIVLPLPADLNRPRPSGSPPGRQNPTEDTVASPDAIASYSGPGTGNFVPSRATRMPPGKAGNSLAIPGPPRRRNRKGFVITLLLVIAIVAVFAVKSCGGSNPSSNGLDGLGILPGISKAAATQDCQLAAWMPDSVKYWQSACTTATQDIRSMDPRLPKLFKNNELRQTNDAILHAMAYNLMFIGSGGNYAYQTGTGKDQLKGLLPLTPDVTSHMASVLKLKSYNVQDGQTDLLIGLRRLTSISADLLGKPANVSRYNAEVAACQTQEKTNHSSDPCFSHLYISALVQAWYGFKPSSETVKPFTTLFIDWFHKTSKQADVYKGVSAFGPKLNSACLQLMNTNKLKQCKS